MDDNIAERAQKLKDNASDRNDLMVLDSNAMARAMVDMIKPFLEPVNVSDIDFSYSENNHSGERELILHLTDAHCGKKSASYSTEIMKKRLSTVYSELCKVAYELRSNDMKINRLVVLLGGDLVDGDTLYPGQPFFIDSAVYKQIAEMSAELTKFFIGLAGLRLFGSIEIFHVPGNHGRVSKHTHTKNNWDLFMYMLLQSNLSNTNIIMHPGENWYVVVPTMHEPILLTHGDGINMYQNIPLYGMIQAAMRWSGSIPEKFKYVMIGHFHVPMDMQWNNLHLFVNGCFVSDDEWVLKTLKLSTEPQQRLLVINKDGIESEKLIKLK
jgi:hypothetical protein